MQRKTFLSSIIPAAFSIKQIATGSINEEDDFNNTKIPPYLKPGDIIGITSPAGFITPEDCAAAIETFRAWGFRVRIGNTIGKKDFSFGGTDKERAYDIQAMLDDPSVNAIMCARGGYGVARIIDRLDFKIFKRAPKWIIGFSDITVLHSHILKHTGIASLHSKMCNSFLPFDKADEEQKQGMESIRKALVGNEMIYDFAPSAFNRTGRAEGILAGGNLKTLESVMCTPSDFSFDHKILFFEDTGEYLYSIDRMFGHLKRSGKLAKLKGLIIGGFKIKRDDEGEAFGRNLYEIVSEATADYSYPVCFNFPVGHQKNNLALKCGVMHELNIGLSLTTLKSLA